MINLSTAQETINALLLSTGIKSVYYVDDKFEEDKSINERFEEFQNAITRCHEEGKTDAFPERVRFSDEANLDAEIRRWWSELPSTEVKQQLIEKYVDGGTENTRPATLIREIFGEKCECCSPTEWNNRYKRIALEKIGQKETTLLLFDHDLSNGHTGFQYAEETLAVPEAINCTYCGIISQQFTTNEEFSKRVEYKTKQPEYYIYPLSKQRLVVEEENYGPFIDGLKNILWVKHIELLNMQAAHILNNAFEQTTKKYLAIQPPAYKKIIIESSQKEGCREIDTILRLMQIILDKEVKQAISEENLSAINNEISKISKIHDSQIIDQYPEINQQAKAFLKDEKFLEGKIINSLYTPLQNGDIFRINKKLYVLLCQPCNISIRADGNRGNNYDTGFLIQLELTKNVGMRNASFSTIWEGVEKMFSEEEKQAKSQELNSHKKKITNLLALANPLNIPLDFDIDGKDYTVKLNNFKTISLSLLDNVAFNEEGNAIIHFNLKKAPKGLHKTMIERRKHIKKQFKSWSKIEEGVKELCYDCQWLMDEKEIFSNFFQEIKIESIEILSDKIKLPIQRIGHYRRPYSDDLLTQFSHYISRAGFPNSFI